jgi:hypothetical protein
MISGVPAVDGQTWRRLSPYHCRCDPYHVSPWQCARCLLRRGLRTGCAEQKSADPQIRTTQSEKAKGTTDLDDLRLPQYTEQVRRSLDAPLTALLPFSVTAFPSAIHERDSIPYTLSEGQLTIFQAIYLPAYVQTNCLSVEVRPDPEHIFLSLFISKL